MEPKQVAVDALNRWIRKSGENIILTLAAPMKATMKFPDGGFKVKPLLGNEEFFLRGCRLGKKDILFELKPVAAAAYEQVEMPQKVAIEVFEHEGLEGLLIGALEIAGRKSSSFASAVAAFVAEAEVVKEKERAEVNADNYATNPQWGMF